jgi:hypothetical protein
MLHHLAPSKQNESIPTVPPEGQKEEWKALKPCVKTDLFSNWTLRSQESMW